MTHPVFWLSRVVEPYRDRAELIERLNANRGRIGVYLDAAASISEADAERLGPQVAAPAQHVGLRRLVSRRDVVRLDYEADGSSILNAALTYDPHWAASVNGRQAKVVRGNFNGLAIALPPGTGIVELTYRSWTSLAFLLSRLVLLSAALFLVVVLTRTVLRVRGDGR